MSKRGLGKFLLGLGAGIGLGILLAPKKGSETRKDLKEKLDNLIAKVKDLDKDEVKAKIEDKIEEIKEEIKSLDGEKVLKIAKEKSKEIMQSIEELYEYAKKKATPVIEKAVDGFRETAIKVTKEVLTKLENTK